MSEEDYRPVHPLTPMLRAWAVIPAVVAAVVFNIGTERLRGAVDAARHIGAPSVLIGLGALVLGLAITWLVALPWWRATGYHVGTQEIALRRGVVGRRVRTARFDRVQAVDVVEPLLPRLFALAAVRVETAGGADSVLAIEFLRRTDAEALREELLSVVRRRGGDPTGAAPVAVPAGIGSTPAVEGGQTPAAGARAVAEVEVVPAIPIARSMIASALSSWTVVAVVSVPLAVLTPLGLAVLPVLLSVLPQVWTVIDHSWRFTARRGDGVLDLAFGLADRRRQSIRIDRVHAVSLEQPLLWRLTGWWRVRADIAGYGGEGEAAGTTTILPVGDIGQALRLLSELGPLSAEEIEEFADPHAASRASFVSPDRARLVSPVDLRQQAVTLVHRRAEAAPHAVITHAGRFHRRMNVVACRHIQELTLRRGPVQNVLGLSRVRLDLVTGPVSMNGEDLTVTDAEDLLAQLRARPLPPAGPVSNS